MAKLPVKNVFLTLTMAALAYAATIDEAFAIPAFTRQIKKECSTCHTIFPELNEQGTNFSKNSYTDKTGETASETPAVFSQSGLPQNVPLSISGTINAWYNPNATGNDEKLGLVTRSVRLLAGGNLHEKLGFWLTYNMYSARQSETTASNAAPNNLPDIDEIFGQWRSLYGSPANLKVGRFQPSLSLWKKSNRTSVSEYATTSYLAGYSPFNSSAPANGAEINSILKDRFFVAGGARKTGNQNNPDLYCTAQYKWGGTDFNGEEMDADLEHLTFFDYLTMTLGGYGYIGNNSIGETGQTNNFYRYGFDGGFNYKRFRMKLASVSGSDDNAITDYSGNTPTKLDSTVLLAEAGYLFGSNVITTFRYEYIDNGAVVDNRYISSIAYAFLQNAKIVTEYKITERKDSTNSIVNLAIVGAF